MRTAHPTRLTNFTAKVPIPSSKTHFWTKIKADGADVRFTSSDETTLLKFEIEKFDNTADDAVYHVKILTLTSATSTDIYLYYGNASATSGEDIANTWDTTFKAVWHLSQNKAAGAFADSTSNANNGTNTGTTDVAGQIDRGRALDTTGNQHITVADSNSLSFGNGTTDQPFSIAFWIKLLNTTADRYIGANKGTNGADVEYLCAIENSTSKPFFNIYSVTGQGTSSPRIGRYASAGISLNTVHRVVGTYSGSGADSGIQLYVDGAAISHVVNNYLTYNKTNNSIQPAQIGGLFEGINSAACNIDEVLIDGKEWSLDWVKADYQSGIGTWLSFGVQEAIWESSLTCVSTLSGTLSVDILVSGNITAISTLSGALTTSIRLASTLSAETTLTGNLQVTGWGGVIQAQSTLTGNLTTGINLLAAMNSLATLAGALQVGGVTEDINWLLQDSVLLTGVSGLTSLKIVRQSDNAMLDWNDLTFKTSGWGSYYTTFGEVDAVKQAGVYRKNVEIGGWSEGKYYLLLDYNGTPGQHDGIEFTIKNGRLIFDYIKNMVDVPSSSRLSTVGYTAPDNAGVSFLNKWVLNRLIESPAGTFKLYDNDDVTVLKTWAVDDVNKTRSKAV